MVRFYGPLESQWTTLDAPCGWGTEHCGPPPGEGGAIEPLDPSPPPQRAPSIGRAFSTPHRKSNTEPLDGIEQKARGAQEGGPASRLSRMGEGQQPIMTPKAPFWRGCTHKRASDRISRINLEWHCSHPVRPLTPFTHFRARIQKKYLGRTPPPSPEPRHGRHNARALNIR